MSSATGILGRKVGMTQVFDEKGLRIGVTVIEAGPCKVLQVKTPEKDGYAAVQLGFGDKREKNTSLPLIGHFEKAGSGPKRFVREIRLGAAPSDKPGDDVTVKVLEGVQKVDVSGVTKGKGFTGVVKRWNFRGLPASHGCSKRHRAPGGLGRHMSINKGVPKGKKMAGHLGTDNQTVLGLRLVKIDPENNVLLVKGAVPGANGSFVVVRTSLKEKVRLDKEAKRKAAK
ncbi:MAG: 50S ribosomal protein L3 [Planctomycetota bacterium]|nr:50S ribosomal protein L3 [Planctomycetota bacterium]